MGFEGVGYINTVMKNNRMLLNNHKREKFKGGLGTVKKQKVEYNFPDASPQQLRQIREKMKFENEQLQKKKTIVFLIIILALFMTVTIIVS